MAEKIRVVDIFCGCGGLSLGFELFKGSLEYEVVLGLDVENYATECFNDNHTKHQGGTFLAGRTCNLNWFNHPAEVMLYYLVHFANWLPDADLWGSLNSKNINTVSFLQLLKATDSEYESKRSALIKQDEFISALKGVDSNIFPIAICKAFFHKLGLNLPRGTNALKPFDQPWEEEYTLLTGQEEKQSIQPPLNFTKAIKERLSHFWDYEFNKLVEASRKKGFGLNAPISARLKTLVRFLESDVGSALKDLWLEWRTHRDSVRAFFCNETENFLSDLYTPERRVQLVLGGPPCKGFSRAGRPIVSSLFKQGTSSWASYEYGDERNTLLYKYVLFLEALKPNAFLFENVQNFEAPLDTPSLNRIDPPALLESAIKELSANALNYSVRSSVLQAFQFAVPQNRLRYLMVGFNSEYVEDRIADEFFKLPRYDQPVPLMLALNGLESPGEFQFGRKNNVDTSYRVKVYTLIDENMPPSYLRYLKWVRQADYFTNEPTTTTDGHIFRTARPDDLAMICKFAPGQRWMDYKISKSSTLKAIRSLIESALKYVAKSAKNGLPSEEELRDLLDKADESLLLRLLIEDLDLPLYLKGENHLLVGGYLTRGSGKNGDWFHRLSAMKPSKTIVAHIGKDTYGYIHPFENRAISMREAARIQSFPDLFKLGKTRIVEGYTMIGNAVPPLLANHIAGRFAGLNEVCSLFSSKKRKKRLSQDPTSNPTRVCSTPSQISLIDI